MDSAPTGPPAWQSSPLAVEDPGDPETEGLATAAMICGVVGGALLVIVGPVLGIALGILARRRIRVSGRPGTAMATVGIVGGIAWLALAGVVALVYLLR